MPSGPAPEASPHRTYLTEKPLQVSALVSGHGQSTGGKSVLSSQPPQAPLLGGKGRGRPRVLWPRVVAGAWVCCIPAELAMRVSLVQGELGEQWMSIQTSRRGLGLHEGPSFSEESTAGHTWSAHHPPSTGREPAPGVQLWKLRGAASLQVWCC